MAHLYKHILPILILMVMLHNTSGAKKGSSSKSTSKNTQSSNNPSQGTKTEPKSPKQPSSPAKGNKQGGFAKSGSNFSRSVQNRAHSPSVKSKGFGKQAALAAGAGGLAGMAVGYGVRQVPQGESYDQFMNTCMKRTDLLKERDTLDSVDHKNIQRDEALTGPDNVVQGRDWSGQRLTTSPTTNNAHLMPAGVHTDEDNDTVSILKIGYPALIQQMKARACIQHFLAKLEKDILQSRSNGHFVSMILLLLTTFMHVLHHK